MTARVRASCLGVVTALVALAGTACAIDLRANDYTVREEQIFKVEATAAPEVELSTFDGSIEVRSWDRAEIRIEVEKRGANKDVVDAIEVRMSQEGNRVSVRAEPSKTGGWLADLAVNTSHSAKLIATVPGRCELRLRSGDGSVKVEGVSGPMDIETDDGSVRGVGLGGTVQVRTGDGSIKLETIEGRVEAETGDGSIVLSGKLAGVQAKTGDGSMSIRLDAGSRPETDWHISTNDGAIALEVPEAFSAELDATTLDGVVRADATLGLAGSDTPGRAMQGRLGEGGRTITVRSGDGSISVRRR